jgi:hypothetical protein
VFDKRRDNCCFHDWFTWRIFVANDTVHTRTHARTHSHLSPAHLARLDK